MERKIVRLCDELINQIAAGEVVESPASVVKELVENSLDAEAKRIEIRCVKGGLESIQIEDDGWGMSREDALLSLERHATSKIRTADDLVRLMTMGFRGEALAAIAAISHLDMKTSLGFEGTHLRASAGKIIDVEPIARNRGTTIEVRSLFYNVPARKKFQKSTGSCTAQIHRIVEAIALAHPSVAFSLQIDGKSVLDVRPQEKKERVETLLQPFAHEGSTDTMWGFFGSPGEAKTHRRSQFLYINERPIFSPVVSRAVKEGYGTRIKENEHPIFILFLDWPPNQVDFNVHPQKKEVRFSDESFLFQRVRGMVSALFEKEAETLFQEPIFFEPKLSWMLAEDPPPPTPIRSEPIFMPMTFPEKALAVFDSYLLIEREGLLLVDLDAAARRIAFETRSDRAVTRHYSLEEGIEIWKQLQKCRDLRYDPLGRPIWKEIKPSDWEKILR